MITDELRALKKYIISECKANCRIGETDTDPDDYPLVEIQPVNPIPLSYDNRQLVLVNMQVSLKIIVAKENIIVAHDVFERILQKINQFNFHKGHEIEHLSEALPAYDTDNGTYFIIVPYMLRLKVQDS